jgi:FADH2 O2-dependent halogenase
VVNSSFVSFENYQLWNAVFRVWAYGGVPGNLRLERLIDKFDETGDVNLFAALEDVPNVGLWWPDSPGYRELFDHMVRLCDRVDAGDLDADVAGKELMDRISTAEFVAPRFGFRERDTRFITPTKQMLKDMMRWIATEAPQDMRYLADGGRFGVPAGPK